jgi:DNA-binding response OmpR family regulator
MLTAKNRLTDMKLSMDKGANDYVGKPFEAE